MKARESGGPTRQEEALFQVTAPYFCAGFRIREGKVVDAAPILRKWTLGRSLAEVRVVAAKRGFSVQEVALPEGEA